MEKSIILIVDDNPKNLQVLANVLVANNFDVEYCLDGKTAIEWVKKKQFDLILLDIMMPEMDGYTTCVKIKELPDKKGVPVIFITAKTDIESLTKAFNAGGIDYITKPFNTKELLIRVNTHLDLKKHKDKLEDLVAIRTQELQEAYKELESLDVAKAEFLNILSHEIRTPMNGIKGFLELLKSKIKDETLLKYLNYMDESTYRLEKFAIQALLITELRTKRRKIVYTKIYLKSALEQLIKSEFESTIIAKQLKIRFDINPEDVYVSVDNELFTKCVLYIIENAVHYCKTKGLITIKAFNSDLGVNLEFVDEGPGFSDKALNNLFKLFAPGETHINENMGIDLALVDLIMKAHEGTFEVKNNLDIGANVRLVFPNNSNWKDEENDFEL